jgi:DNA replication protein DnaC
MNEMNRQPGIRSLSAAIQSGVHRPPLVKQAECDRHGPFQSLCHLGDIWLGCPACAAAERKAERLRDEQQRRAVRVQEWEARMGRAGIPERFRDRTLQSYVVSHEGQQMALDFAQAYADDFDRVRKTGRSAIFMGNFGTGKTHLAVGIGLQVMREHKASVLFATAGRMVRMVKDSWARNSGVTESDVVAQMVFPDLLIVDEVGVQQGTEFERNVMFEVLNDRYEQRKPSLLLTNHTVEDLSSKYLGERVVDRLREDGGAVLKFSWDSGRRDIGGLTA